MHIEPGQELLHYRIVDKVGEGGMGVVWRALDTTLDRDVAIKVLPEALATDPERLARFEREAKLLASLKHPNIADIYGLHDIGGARFIAMELVEGQDLSERIAQGALPEREVLEVARQIAAALEAAHEQGVIHRDLKPANVKLTPDGQIKVLDFGLAKAFQQDPASGDAGPSMSPTLTSLGTVAGVILGTAAYMAPEQARGQAVDKRADIWALGCVIYEALTGRSPFRGETISDTLAAVLKTEPDQDTLPDDTDPTLRVLLARCLEKDVRQRLRDVGELRIALERLLSGAKTGYGLAVDLSLATAAAAEPPRRSPLPVALALVVVAALAAAAGWWLRPSDEAEGVVRRLDILAPGLDVGYMRWPVLSPDGSRLAYVGEGGIQVRALDELEARAVPGSDRARNLMWSPDGEELAWLGTGKLWRASVSGGAPTAVCDLPGRIESAAWGADDRVILTPDEGPLMEVSARGGDPRAFLEPVEGKDQDFHVPSFLPDGRGFVVTVHPEDSAPDTIEVVVDGERKVLLRIEDHWLGWPQVTADGYLVYVRGGGNDGIWAAPFSLDDLVLTGEPVLVDPLGARPGFANDGSMVYFRGSPLNELQLVWIDREGKVEPIGEPLAGLVWPSVSPDGQRIAISIDGEDSMDIWVQDVVRGTRTRLTFDDDSDWAPSWHPDGRRVVFGRQFGSASRILSVAADGSEEPIELASGEVATVTPDGANIVFEKNSPETEDDLFYASASERGEPTLVLSTAQGEEHAQISPDGRYVAYTSAESGRDEVYLKRFPEGTGKWQVSIDGGDWARWNPAGGEIFFLARGQLMVVEVDLGETARLSTPRVLLSAEALRLRGRNRPYDVAPDGRRFVTIRGIEGDTREPSLTFVENWAEGLK